MNIKIPISKLHNKQYTIHKQKKQETTRNNKKKLTQKQTQNNKHKTTNTKQQTNKK